LNGPLAFLGQSPHLAIFRGSVSGFDTSQPFGVRGLLMFAKLHNWRWWIWGAFLTAWSTALLMPVPHDPWIIGQFEFSRKLIFAKSLHLGAYTFLTILTAWLRAPLRYRFLLVFLLMAHATLTEVLQFLLEFIGRHGSLMDVALDQVGIALGILLTWKWWTGGVKEGW
jgi:hypothetical protein